MIRLPDWPARLAAFLRARRDLPFQWGAQDCCLFAADGVLAMTGIDFAEDYRGYADRRGAVAALRRVAGGGSVAAAWRALGDPLPSVLRAQRGDVMALACGGWHALGLVGLDGKSFCVAAREGVRLYPLRAARFAWRV